MMRLFEKYTPPLEISKNHNSPNCDILMYMRIMSKQKVINRKLLEPKNE